jgi:hypothetical protein
MLKLAQKNSGSSPGSASSRKRLQGKTPRHFHDFFDQILILDCSLKEIMLNE